MTLKAIKQFTNTGWIIGGVAVATGGYSYLTSSRIQTTQKYIRKPLTTISSLDDIEDWENQKGCLFVFYTQSADKAKQNPPAGPRYNEFYQGGVLNARNYVAKDKKNRESKVIDIANKSKEECASGKLLYKEIEGVQEVEV